MTRRKRSWLFLLASMRWYRGFTWIYPLEKKSDFGWFLDVHSFFLMGWWSSDDVPTGWDSRLAAWTLPFQRVEHPQTLLDTKIFTHKHFYTQTLYTKTLLQIKIFTRKTLLHTKHFYTQIFLHTGIFTYKQFYIQTVLHTGIFT